MPAERAGYTVTMFCIDVSPSMGKLRTVEVPDPVDGGSQTVEMTNLAWSLQYVLLKIQEMIYNGRKTDQCGVILFGTEETNNIINNEKGGYDHVSECIPIAQPNAGTLTKLQALQPSTEIGDPIDAIIVAIQTQDRYLEKKKTWTRKMVLLTDGENPIEIEDWEVTVSKINSLNINTKIIGTDFDDEEFGFKEEDKSNIKEEDKSNIKLENEKFFRRFINALNDGLGMIGTCEEALIDCRRPDVKETKSVLLGTTLRIGDVDTRDDEAIELPVKMSKCTAIQRPPSMKKFAKRVQADSGEEPATQTQESALEDGDEEKKDVYVQLAMHTEYLVSEKEEEEEAEKEETEENLAEKVDKDQLIRGFKYGASYAPCPDGQFPRLSTRKGIDICGFFPDHMIRRELAMGEIQYVWADPSQGSVQVSFSSIVQAMVARKIAAIARLVSRDGMDPKMGLLIPRQFENVDCLLWMQMPFADDVRKYTFPSLENLVSKKGEKITKHPFIPTDEQLEAMEDFVDAMDLMHAGDKDESGERGPWFDPRYSYNPAVHRIKQALFHAAIVTDLRENPLPPPHEEVIKYFESPRRVIKKAQPALEECKKAFKIKQVPKRILRARKDGHVRAEDDEDELLLLDRSNVVKKTSSPSNSASPIKNGADASTDASGNKEQTSAEKSDKMDVDSETEPESDEGVPGARGITKRALQLPSPEPTIFNGTFTDSQSQSQSQSQPLDLDIGKEPGHIIGAARPLIDFKQSLKDGDDAVTSQAINEMTQVINNVLSKPFARRRHEEMLEFDVYIRCIPLQKGQVDSWNTFLTSVKESCLSSTKINNKPFWEEVRKVGVGLSLISESEAKQSGTGSLSKVSDEDAEKFLQA
ncbi:SPOC domain-like protein [Sanghuangporus baumii]|uniref:ATP-dependent DNA helicase II subunit 2 n=1 Tax=Sanghuangporus baumii TaxID=108892 RepID=A0A9Q5I058_SANBA|nr:SPOC domain-like protein [Sanghuangporus baumii]